MDWRASSYRHRRSRRHLRHCVSEQIIERDVLSKGHYIDHLATTLIQQAGWLQVETDSRLKNLALALDFFFCGVTLD